MSTTTAPRRASTMRRREKIWGLAFVTPISLQVVLFCVIPIGIAIYAGFTNWNALSENRDFVGLENFTTFLTDKYFWIAAGNTIVMLLPIPFYLIFGILFAIGSHRGTPGSTVFRILFFLPYISSIVALVVLWKWLFNYQYGLVNQFLALFGIQGPDWLGDPAWIKTTIVIMIAWKMIGITSIYILAALKNIPDVYYEAARIDGASVIRQFFQITLPMLTPALFFLTIVGIIGSLQTFVEVQLFTSDGGRNYSAATITYYIWQKAFGSGELGLASATALFFALAILGVTLIQFRLSRRWVYEGE
ncbi:MAG: sugar ABC transporter permease [Rhodoglobus sp.]|uniref:carbohydrate ABC transporter permease n=1 Tax=Microbacterium aurum TaxID=36805 RepID=UPI00248E2E8A|nr:sugar ABC transporter permease [Microbacterium aurum]MDZ4044729.1 sugar ABC transporter permease [Rhodoglobus sp.]